jgi:hypothetical protein
LSEQQIATGQHFDTRVMSIEPAPVLHRFVPLTQEPDFLRLGWMRERPLSKPPVQTFGAWLLWPCACPSVEPPGAVCGGRWHRCVPLPTHGGGRAEER